MSGRDNVVGWCADELVAIGAMIVAIAAQTETLRRDLCAVVERCTTLHERLAEAAKSDPALSDAAAGVGKLVVSLQAMIASLSGSLQ